VREICPENKLTHPEKVKHLVESGVFILEKYYVLGDTGVHIEGGGLGGESLYRGSNRRFCYNGRSCQSETLEAKALDGVDALPQGKIQQIAHLN